MVTHTKSRFETVVAGLNQAFEGWMVFQLAGSLSEKPASAHDADIIVYPKLLSGVKGFLQGCKEAGIEIVALDDTSTTPFPGRPDGQDRIQVKLISGHTVDLFFPKGYLSEADAK
jgi:hypothetical protein